MTCHVLIMASLDKLMPSAHFQRAVLISILVMAKFVVGRVYDAEETNEGRFVTERSIASCC